VLATSLAAAPATRLAVKVVDVNTTTEAYYLEVSSHANVSCGAVTCSVNATQGRAGTATVTGGLITLQLLDGTNRLALVECSSKPDNGANIANAFGAGLGGPTVSPVYRNCRLPSVNAVIRAEFRGSDVKLFIQAPSLNGTGKTKSETYILREIN